jgi:hypothetical protein
MRYLQGLLILFRLCDQFTLSFFHLAPLRCLKYRPRYGEISVDLASLASKSLEYVSTWMIWALAVTGAPLLWLFIVPELAWGVVQWLPVSKPPPERRPCMNTMAGKYLYKRLYKSC